MGIIEFFINLILEIISYTGYVGIFFLMTLESACIPVPSEIVMPFAGYLVYENRFNMILVTLAGTLGCLFGSLIAYFVGLYLGRSFILKYKILFREHHLHIAEKWFEKYGDFVIFFTRLMPIIRTFISLPAGIGKMNLKKFIVYTFFGSLPWCFLLAYVGYVLGPNWEDIVEFTRKLDIVVIVVLIIIVCLYIWRLKKMKKNKK
jgi:membrane protein DedA with SNARE-associated domain